LHALLESLDDIDGNGNALLESPALSKGYSVRAVRSTNGEVFVPQKEANKKSEENTMAAVAGWDEYQTARHFLRRGFVCEASALEESETAAVDAVALQKWRQDMRGSALAGFQLAMRAGSLCEEPVRSVAVVLESVELAVTDETAGDNGSAKHRVAKDLTGGMVVAALRSGVRCALL
jgi:translation elongation factor EF-G